MSKKLYDDVLSVCGEVVGTLNIVAIGVYGSRVCGYARKDSDYDVLLILDGYDEGARYYYKNMQNTQFAILVVDKKAIEIDARKGKLGDFIVGRLTSPYIPLLNTNYLRKIELETKRRFVKEDLEDLIIEYGELARGLVIKPEYLVLARMKKRVRSYSPLKFSYIKMLNAELREKNMYSILNGYVEVLNDLANSKFIKFDGENIILENLYIDNILTSRIKRKVVNLVKVSEKTIYAYITHGKAGRVKLDIMAKELASKIKRELTISFEKKELEDPKKYLFLKTKGGLINLNEKKSITEVMHKIIGNERVTIIPLGGALNEVYIAEVGKDKLVIKKFTDWFNLKWFVLNIAAYGTKVFTLSGRTRLYNEYAINRLLTENNISVPEIVFINIQERLLIERYIEGNSMQNIVKEAIETNSLTQKQKYWAVEVGKLIAKIHMLEVTLGDCKPENFIISTNDKIYVLDLEQGERKGDAAWDIAEYCYFSGHYGNTLTTGLQQFIKNFIEGYTQIGNRETLRKAGQFSYGRVFIGWSPLPIIQGIGHLLKE